MEVAGIMPLTGAGSGPIQMQLAGFQDYFRYFNEQEAIPGVSIKLTWADTNMQYSLFRSHYEKFVARGIPLILATESDPVAGLKGRFAADEVVVCGSATGFQDMCYSPGWRYFISPTLAEQFAVVAKYFMENWKEARTPRLAFVGCDFTWGREPLSEGTKYAQSLGFEVLAPEFVPMVTLDASTQLLRLKGEEADFAYIQALPAAAGPVLRDAERLGLLGQMQFGGNPIGMPKATIEMTGIASEGFLMPFTTPWFDETEVPGIRLMIDNRMKYHNEEVKRDASYRNGWLEAAIVCEAVKRAIEDVGYENLDGAAIKEELDNMEDFDVYGLASITYKDRALDHRGITKLAVYEVRDGKEVRLTDWQEAVSLVPPDLVRE